MTSSSDIILDQNIENDSFQSITSKPDEGLSRVICLIRKKRAQCSFPPLRKLVVNMVPIEATMSDDLRPTCCGSTESTSLRWRVDNPFTRYALVLTMLLTLPTCEGGSQLQKATVDYYWAEVNLTYFNPITNEQEYETVQGKYGAKSLIETRSGIAVHVRNKENKTHGCDEYENRLPKEKWIALVERGVCYFSVKIRVATKKHNASAVVVYNNVNDGMTIMQHSVEDQVSIFVSQEAGRKLAWLADQGLRVMMTINPGKKDTSELRPNEPRSIFMTWLPLLFVAVIFVIVLLVFMRVCRRRHSPELSLEPFLSSINKGAFHRMDCTGSSSISDEGDNSTSNHHHHYVPAATADQATQVNILVQNPNYTTDSEKGRMSPTLRRTL